MITKADVVRPRTSGCIIFLLPEHLNAAVLSEGIKTSREVWVSVLFWQSIFPIHVHCCCVWLSAIPWTEHARLLCPSPSPKVCPSSCPSHQWCDQAISFSDTLFSFCPQSFPASGTFPVTQTRGFPGGSAGKESACNAGDLGSIPGSGRCPGQGLG